MLLPNSIARADKPKPFRAMNFWVGFVIDPPACDKWWKEKISFETGATAMKQTDWLAFSSSTQDSA
eukprot:7266992-Ditylum_brightwellii.AAC.1